ncbi:MAG: Phytochrome-like protein cph2 [Spirochaetes bacterium ADurb.BinA120]|nr:MAG: Phytochrome-like protein cph2 [Spirochaetes bacterium ADurb.BinA120]HPV97746.1 EAL domain-containing protein [Spirochaetota bacterium]
MPRGEILIIKSPSPHSDQLGSLLTEHGYRVTQRAFGPAADAASAASYDLVIYHLDDSIAGKCAPEDLNPGVDTPSLTIVPAAADYEYLLGCIKCGMRHFLNFPYGRRSLLRRIESIIESGKEAAPSDGGSFRLVLPYGEGFETIEMGPRQLADFIVSSLENNIHRTKMLRRSYGSRRLVGEAPDCRESDGERPAGAHPNTRLEQDLLDAIERDEFEMYYQPIVDMNSGAIMGFESLIRWRHPERGFVPPSEFIPFAEESALILPLGFIAIEKACRQLKEWIDADAGPLSVSINLSAVQFIHPELAEQIADIVRKNGLPHELVRFEITESVLMNDMDSANMMLLKLKSMNFRLYMDDFGTGYSSLSYLRHFPMDVIKIDQSFIKWMGVDDESHVIAKTIVDLAHNLGKLVVAEGIETDEHLAMLREMRCDYGQGYLFSPPIGAGEARALLVKRPRW